LNRESKSLAARSRKRPSRKAVGRRAKRVKEIQQKAAPPEEILFRVEGKMSTFGGPHDLGMSADEGLALFTKLDLQDPKYAYLFLPAPPPGTTGVGRRLNPDQSYFACHWNIVGHDFTPGYSRPGGTSCPDKLFGAAHAQRTIAAWVDANISGAL
jgi:hypothetical protein